MPTGIYKRKPRPSKPWEERFWSKIDVRSENECWLWKAGTNGHGYGTFRMDGKVISAHRVSFFLANGYLPSDAHHNPTCPKTCCNPNHLHDMSRSEHVVLTHKLGQIHHVIDREQALEIRSMRNKGVFIDSIAELFGISRSLVSMIGRNKRWKE